MADKIYLSYILTPLGEMVVVSDIEYILMLEYADNTNMRSKLKSILRDAEIIEQKSEIIEDLEEELGLYFKNALKEFKTPIRMIGTEFQTKSWGELIKIPYGETISYKDQAIRLGDQNASRAVAGANGSNRVAIIVPCHRVIGSDGSLTGYDAGLERKKFLLELERGNKTQSK